MLFDFGWAQRPPHAHDSCTTGSAQQEFSEGDGGLTRNWRIVPNNHHGSCRVLCPLLRFLNSIYRTVRGREQCSIFHISNRLRDSGRCYPTFFRRATILRYRCLIIMANRSSPRSSSFYGSPTGPHSRARRFSPATLVPFISGVKEHR